MLRIFAFALALAMGVVASHPAAAPGTAPAAAAVKTPDQVVQGIADDLGKSIEGHQAELKNDREKLIKLIDGILLPHFDIDYASILVLGQSARTATPEQRARFAQAFYISIAHRYAE